MENVRINCELFNGRLMVDLYQYILDQAGIEWPDDMIFDCTKIDVSRDIMDAAYDSFARHHNAPEWELNMYWANSGPKMYAELPPNTVILHDGFLYRDNTSDTAQEPEAGKEDENEADFEI